MEFTSRLKREGQPVACVYGGTLEGSHLRAGLLFVNANVTEDALTLQSANDPSLNVMVRLPRDFIGQNEAVYGTNEIMEVVNA